MPSIFTPDFGLLFWMLLAFLVVFVLLAKFGFPVIVKMVDERKAYIDGSLKSAREANEKLAHIKVESEKILKEVASAGGGVYIKAGNSEFGLNPIVDSIRKMDEEQFSSVVFEEFDEQYMYFFAIALVFFVIEMLIGERRSKRHLFN